jgi:hypothetical protein
LTPAAAAKSDCRCLLPRRLRINIFRRHFLRHDAAITIDYHYGSLHYADYAAARPPHQLMLRHEYFH